VLIFGWGPFPRMGVEGAALATVITNAFAVVGFVYYLIRGKLTLTLKMLDMLKFDFVLFWQMTKIGLPISLNGILFSVVYVFMNKITASYGTEAIAALGVGNRSEAISCLICFGISVAVATMVGQNLGAGKPDRAEKSVYIALLISIVITGVISILFLAIPGLITRAFISNELVVEYSSDYLRILALSQVFMALLIVLEGAFSGAGDTMPPMLIGIPAAILRLPIAYVLCFMLNVGVNGVWWAITTTTILSAVVLLFWFRKGRWKLREIH